VVAEVSGRVAIVLKWLICMLLLGVCLVACDRFNFSRVVSYVDPGSEEAELVENAFLEVMRSAGAMCDPPRTSAAENGDEAGEDEAMVYCSGPRTGLAALYVAEKTVYVDISLTSSGFRGPPEEYSRVVERVAERWVGIVGSSRVEVLGRSDDFKEMAPDEE